jgi:hypothetical protein
MFAPAQIKLNRIFTDPDAFFAAAKQHDHMTLVALRGHSGGGELVSI